MPRSMSAHCDTAAMDLRRVRWRRIWRLLLFCVVPGLVLLTGVGWVPRRQSNAGTVAGRITNQTAGGTVPKGLEVTLHGFRGIEETQVLTTTASADSTFRFERLDTTAGDEFVVRVVFEDVAYYSAVAGLAAGQDALDLPVAIYDVTEDPSSVFIDTLHLFITLADGHLRVAEYHHVSNSGDRTYVGMRSDDGARTTLTMRLPEGASSLGFDPALGDQRFQYRDGGFADTRPVLPGVSTVEIVFSYELPYREGQPIERVYGLPVEAIHLVLPGDSLRVEGAGIIPAGVLATEMGPAQSFDAGPLLAGEPLVFTPVAEQDAASGTASTATSTTQARGDVIVGLAALALAALALYLLWRPAGASVPPVWARDVVSEMVDLDVAFEAGWLSEGEHRSRRAELDRRLRDAIAERTND